MRSSTDTLPKIARESEDLSLVQLKQTSGQAEIDNIDHIETRTLGALKQCVLNSAHANDAVTLVQLQTLLPVIETITEEVEGIISLINVFIHSTADQGSDRSKSKDHLARLSDKLRFHLRVMHTSFRSKKKQLGAEEN